MRADTEWQCRQEDMLSLRLRDTRTSSGSGVVYSSPCRFILPSPHPHPPSNRTPTEKEQLHLETTQNSVLVNLFLRCVYPSRTGDAVITCFRCAWCCLPAAGMCSCRQNAAAKKWWNVPLTWGGLSGSATDWLSDVALNQFVKYLCVCIDIKSTINNVDSGLIIHEAKFPNKKNSLVPASRMWGVAAFILF